MRKLVNLFVVSLENVVDDLVEEAVRLLPHNLLDTVNRVSLDELDRRGYIVWVDDKNESNDGDVLR